MENNMTGRNVGKTCRTHYRGTFNDGTQFDCSYDRGEPLEFVCGAGQMIRGFDEAVADMEVGEIKEIHLQPEDAYGLPDPRAAGCREPGGRPAGIPDEPVRSALPCKSCGQGREDHYF